MIWFLKYVLSLIWSLTKRNIRLQFKDKVHIAKTITDDDDNNQTFISLSTEENKDMLNILMVLKRWKYTRWIDGFNKVPASFS